MQQSSFLIFLLAATFAPIFSASPEPARQPAYPLFGILERDPALANTQNDLTGVDFSQIGSTQLIYSAAPELGAVRDARKLLGGGPAVIVYMGGFTTNHSGATAIEKGYRRATAMIDITTLSAALDEHSSEVRVVVPADHELPIQASTADLSDPKDSKKFCFWIRVGDELMQVKAVDATSGLLRVKRGFESKIASHAVGAAVLTPVYVGNRGDLGALRHSNSWPGGPDYLRYAVEPRSTAAQDYKASIIIELMKSGYDGAWLDTFQGYKLYNLCDGLGRPVHHYYDFATGRRYTQETYYAALRDYIRGLRARVRKATGRNPVLVANNVAGSYEFGGKSLFRTTEQPDLLDGYCFEDSYIGITNRVKRGGAVSLGPLPANHWMRNLTNQSDAASSGLRAYNMIAMAGYVAANLNPRLPDYDRITRFGYGSFLLTVTKERTTAFGLPLLLTERQGKPAFLPWPEILFAPIGDPVDGTFDAKRTAAGGDYYERRFTNGIVYVNPAGAKPAEVAVPAGFADWQTGRPVKTVHLATGDSVLLLRAKP